MKRAKRWGCKRAGQSLVPPTLSVQINQDVEEPLKFIGRMDPLMDRKNGKLIIKGVHAESHAPKDKDISREIRDSVEQLSEFLGAKEVVYSRKVPKYWQSHLH